MVKYLALNGTLRKTQHNSSDAVRDRKNIWFQVTDLFPEDRCIQLYICYSAGRVFIHLCSTVGTGINLRDDSMFGPVWVDQIA